MSDLNKDLKKNASSHWPISHQWLGTKTPQPTTLYTDVRLSITLAGSIHVREFCTLNIGSPGDLGVTRVGDDNWIMAYVHVAHDCVIGNKTIFANNTQLAGHVHVDDWVIFGGFTVVHQFVRVGAHAMTAMNSLLFADLPPYVMAQGQPAGARSMNFEGLRRRGFSAQRIAAVKAMHKALYRDGLTLQAAYERIQELAITSPESSKDVAMMTTFLDAVSDKRGIVR